MHLLHISGSSFFRKEIDITQPTNISTRIQLQSEVIKKEDVVYQNTEPRSCKIQTQDSCLAANGAYHYATPH